MQCKNLITKNLTSDDPEPTVVLNHVNASWQNVSAYIFHFCYCYSSVDRPINQKRQPRSQVVLTSLCLSRS